MRPTSLAFFLFATASVFLVSMAAPNFNYNPNVEEIYKQFLMATPKEGVDLLLALLPVYGWIKVSNMIKPRSLDQVKVNIHKKSLFSN